MIYDYSLIYVLRDVIESDRFGTSDDSNEY